MRRRQGNLSILKAFGSLRKQAFFVFLALAFLSSSYIDALAQLPPTNMGQFVHQPGDNQYTYQTQNERHPPVVNVPVAPAVPTVAPANAPRAEYKTTPAASKPDVSLLPIVADEPIKPAGFPPLPDRLDLPSSGGVWTPNNGVHNGVSSTGAGVAVEPISSSPTGIHQHYVHYNPGAFMPKEEMQDRYRPVSADYYNVNPGVPMNAGATAAGPVPVETPSMQALKRMGNEPLLAPDAVSKPEVPSAVTVNQSVSQDLSLPEDDFNKHYPTAVNNSSSNRAGRHVGQAFAYPARYLLYSGAAMAASAGMYAIRR